MGWIISIAPPRTIGKIMHINTNDKIDIWFFFANCRKSKIKIQVNIKYKNKWTTLSSFSNVGTPLKVEGEANERYKIHEIKIIDFQ